MPFVIAQWTCRTCKGTHRVRYPLITSTQAKCKANSFLDVNGVRISDPAFLVDLKGKRRDSKTRKYALIADPLTPLDQIIDALRAYINKYYTIEQKTLIVELCDDGE